MTKDVQIRSVIAIMRLCEVFYWRNRVVNHMSDLMSTGRVSGSLIVKEYRYNFSYFLNRTRNLINAESGTRTKSLSIVGIEPASLSVFPP